MSQTADQLKLMAKRLQLEADKLLILADSIDEKKPQPDQIARTALDVGCAIHFLYPTRSYNLQAWRTLIPSELDDDSVLGYDPYRNGLRRFKFDKMSSPQLIARPAIDE